MRSDPQLATDARNSPIVHALVRQAAIVQALRKIAADDPDAGRDAYAHNPAGAEAAADAELGAMTDDELSELIGAFPHHAARFVDRAFGLIDKALVLIGLPDELVRQIDGHTIALFGAALLAAEVDAAQPEMDADGDEG